MFKYFYVFYILSSLKLKVSTNSNNNKKKSAIPYKLYGMRPIQDKARHFAFIHFALIFFYVLFVLNWKQRLFCSQIQMMNVRPVKRVLVFILNSFCTIHTNFAQSVWLKLFFLFILWPLSIDLISLIALSSNIYSV